MLLNKNNYSTNHLCQVPSFIRFKAPGTEVLNNIQGTEYLPGTSLWTLKSIYLSFLLLITSFLIMTKPSAQHCSCTQLMFLAMLLLGMGPALWGSSCHTGSSRPAWARDTASKDKTHTFRHQETQMYCSAEENRLPFKNF